MNDITFYERLYQRHCEGDDLAGEAQREIEQLNAMLAEAKQTLWAQIDEIGRLKACRDMLLQKGSDLKDDNERLRDKRDYWKQCYEDLLKRHREALGEETLKR